LEVGSEVDLTVQLDPTVKLGKYEKAFVSVSVTDLSPFIKVPEHQHMPSLPSMIYLEKEIRQLNGHIDEFDNSKEFIDVFYKDSSSVFNQVDLEKSAALNIDLLLGN
jgi:hypothetical protein